MIFLTTSSRLTKEHLQDNRFAGTTRSLKGSAGFWASKKPSSLDSTNLTNWAKALQDGCSTGAAFWHAPGSHEQNMLKLLDRHNRQYDQRLELHILMEQIRTFRTTKKGPWAALQTTRLVDFCCARQLGVPSLVSTQAFIQTWMRSNNQWAWTQWIPTSCWRPQW